MSSRRSTFSPMAGCRRNAATALQPRAPRASNSARPRLVNDKLVTEALALKESGITMSEIARRLKLGVSTTYRLLAEAKE